MHGGARGSGAPASNTNALIHRLYTREVRDKRRAVAQLIREVNATLSELK